MEKKEIWFDARKVSNEEKKLLIPTIIENGYTGIFIEEIEEIEKWSSRIKVFLHVF
jgi:3-dehydroquinate synthase class II